MTTFNGNFLMHKSLAYLFIRKFKPIFNMKYFSCTKTSSSHYMLYVYHPNEHITEIWRLWASNTPAILLLIVLYMIADIGRRSLTHIYPPHRNWFAKQISDAEVDSTTHIVSLYAKSIHDETVIPMEKNAQALPLRA